MRQLADLGALRRPKRLTYPGRVSSEEDARLAARWLRTDLGLGDGPIGSISWSLALRQAELAGLLCRDERQRWNQSNPTRAEFMEALGWTPQPDLEDELVPPSYAQAVMAAWWQDLINGVRAVALMHGQLKEADLPIRDESEIEP